MCMGGNDLPWQEAVKFDIAQLHRNCMPSFINKGVGFLRHNGANWILTQPLMIEQGWSGLHHAAMGGHSECFSCLLQHGADPTVRSVSGQNALDVARKHGKPKAISRAGRCMKFDGLCVNYYYTV